MNRSSNACRAASSACMVLVFLVAVSTSPLWAQQQVLVPYHPGGPSVNGYAEASIPIRYSFLNCNDEINVEFALQPSTVRTSQLYWYNGKAYPVPANTTSPPIYGIQIAAAVRKPGVRIADFAYATHAGSIENSCVSSTNVTAVGLLKTFGVDENNANAVRDFFATLFIPQASVKPYDYSLRNMVIEKMIAEALRAKSGS